jgi:hypothetical protein
VSGETLRSDSYLYGSRESRHYFFEHILRAFYSVPGTGLVFKRKSSTEASRQHDPRGTLNIVVISPAVPVFCMNVRMGVRRQIPERVIHQILVLPVAEVRRCLAVRVIHFIDYDLDIDRIGSQTPMVFECDLHAPLSAVVRHLFERFDANS